MTVPIDLTGWFQPGEGFQWQLQVPFLVPILFKFQPWKQYVSETTTQPALLSCAC